LNFKLIDDLDQSPLIEKQGDPVPAGHVGFREVSGLAIEHEQLFEVDDVVASLLVKYVT
jgi:hypothetical protein